MKPQKIVIFKMEKKQIAQERIATVSLFTARYVLESLFRIIKLNKPQQGIGNWYLNMCS